MNPSFAKEIQRLRLRGRRCVRCGKKLEGYRRIFCGADCRREDRGEKMRLKRDKGRIVGKCPVCGRRAPSGKAGVNDHTGASSHNRTEGAGEGAGGGRKGLREAKKPGGRGPDDQNRRSLSRMLPTVPTLAMVKEKRNSFWLRSGPSPSRR